MNCSSSSVRRDAHIARRGLGMKDIVPQVAAQTSAMEGQRRSVGMFMDGPVGVENGMVSACSSGGCCSSSIGMAWFGDIA